MNEKIIEIKNMLLSKIYMVDVWLKNWKYRNVSLFGLAILLILMTLVRSCTAPSPTQVDVVVSTNRVELAVAKAKEINHDKESNFIDKLPKGWKIVTDGNEFAWVDDDGYKDSFAEDSYDEAVESAISSFNYRIKISKDVEWVEVK